MIPPKRPILLFSSAVLLWQQSGENPVVFCYLIGWGVFANLRSLRFAPIPEFVRNKAACWNPSVTCSTRSTTSKT